MQQTEPNSDAGARESKSGRLRVLFLAPSMAKLGGQAIQCSKLIAKLQTEPSLQIDFIPHDPQMPRGFRWTQRIKYLRTIVTTSLYWSLLLTKAWRYDILHIFSASYYSYLLSVAPAIIIGRLYGKKVILNYRSGEAEDHLANWKLSAVPTARLAHVIVVPSSYLVEVFGKFGLKARSIHNIVDLERFAYRERKSLRPVFLTSRLFEPLYNVGCVLKAFALIQQQIPEAMLTVAGDGWMREELEQLAHDLGLRQTEFVGRVAFEDTPAMYDGADIYLNGTNLDNMPSSITECMAAGLPVVTTNAGGIPFIVTNEESCLMVPCDDHEAMAAAAIRLLKDNDLALKLAAHARVAARKFTWPVVRDEWISLYHELVADSVVSGKRALHLDEVSPTPR